MKLWNRFFRRDKRHAIPPLTKRIHQAAQILSEKTQARADNITKKDLDKIAQDHGLTFEQVLCICALGADTETTDDSIQRIGSMANNMTIKALLHTRTTIACCHMAMEANNGKISLSSIRHLARNNHISNRQDVFPLACLLDAQSSGITGVDCRSGLDGCGYEELRSPFWAVWDAFEAIDDALERKMWVGDYFRLLKAFTDADMPNVNAFDQFLAEHMSDHTSRQRAQVILSLVGIARRIQRDENSSKKHFEQEIGEMLAAARNDRAGNKIDWDEYKKKLSDMEWALGG